ncbi:MAG: HTTM domain-containing protein [Myxococcota bacterium]|nr:HTTM domain-containing protein [Myxococcota bacterium]
MAALESLRARLRGIAGLDPRSLGLFRIGLGVALLADLAGRAPVFRALYGQAGVFPVHFVERVNPGWAKLFFAYLLDDTPPALLAVVALAVAGAVALAFGWRTRAATALSWFLLVSLQTRNPLATSYEDQVLRALLFFSIFLPLGERYSLDAKQGRASGGSTPVASAASLALIVQFGAIYFFSALLKTGEAWQDGSAVSYTLGQQYVARPLADWALGFPAVLSFLTRLTFVWELAVGFALLTPVWNGPLRTLAVLSVWVFHLGLAVFLQLGLFPWVMMLGGVALLPPWFWTQLARAWPLVGESPAGDRRSPSWLVQVFPAAALAYVVASNLASLEAARLPGPLGWLGGTLRLDQSWKMYAPQPETVDYFYVIPGTLADGRRVDLARDGRPLSFEAPEERPWRAPVRAWALYLDHARVHRAKGLGLALAAWHCRGWNAEHGGRERLVRVEWMQERFDMTADRAHSQRVLGGWTCGGKLGTTRPAHPRPQVKVP